MMFRRVYSFKSGTGGANNQNTYRSWDVTEGCSLSSELVICRLALVGIDVSNLLAIIRPLSAFRGTRSGLGISCFLPTVAW